MPREPVGSMLCLHWEGDPDAEYVRGHVSPEEAREAVRAEWDCGDATTIQTWGRWVPDPTGEYDMRFHQVEEWSRGCFAVTAVLYG